MPGSRLTGLKIFHVGQHGLLGQQEDEAGKRVLYKTHEQCCPLSNMAAYSTKFKWNIGMVGDLLRALSQFKSNMDYRNVEFNADKAKQYEPVRVFFNESFFGPITTTPIHDDIDESENAELLKKVKEEKLMIKKSYSRITEKVNCDKSLVRL